jgi:hypothetical protein
MNHKTWLILCMFGLALLLRYAKQRPLTLSPQEKQELIRESDDSLRFWDANTKRNIRRIKIRAKKPDR